MYIAYMFNVSTISRAQPAVVTLKKSRDLKRTDYNFDMQIIGPTPGQVVI